MARQISRAEAWERTHEIFTQVNFNSFDFNTIKNSLIDYTKLYFPEDFNDYITLDDSQIMSTIREWAESIKDRTLAELSKDILNRNLFKTVIDIPLDDQPKYSELGPKYSKVKDFFGAKENGKYYWHVDEIKDTPYRPYSPDDEDPSTSIYVQRKDNNPIEISKLSKGIEAMTKNYGMYRIFVHSKYFDELTEKLED